MTRTRRVKSPVACLDWALVIVKGLVEQDDGGFYFHSRMAYRRHEADAIARGYAVRGPKVARDINTTFVIEDTRLTDAGRNIYYTCGLARLPQGPRTNAIMWNWSVTTPDPRGPCVRENPGSRYPDYPARYTVEPLKTAAELGEFLLEAVPVMVLTHMACAYSVKVCSGISPAFAAVAADRGFAAFIARKPGHVVNVVATSDQGLVEVDLSHIQFELPAYPEDEDVERVLTKAVRNPFAAVKITRLRHTPHLENPPDAFDKFFDPLDQYARGVKKMQRIRDGKIPPVTPAEVALIKQHMADADPRSLDELRARRNPRRR